MKAFQVTKYDAEPELCDIPIPDPKADEVRLRIHACGLNFADLLMAKGRYQDTPEPPFTLGMEVCGVVDAVGADVPQERIGERVSVFHGSGGLAEYGCFPASACRYVSNEMPDHIAAGFQVAYGTSHLALTRRARLRKGETLLVFGAAGGVGLTAVEIGHALGARVIAVARDDEKLSICKAHGADHGLIPSPDLVAQIKELGGADVIYDPVGGVMFDAALKVANREARILSIGFAAGVVPQIPANHLLVKNIDVIGVYWGGYLKFAPEVLSDDLEQVMALYQGGKLSPHVGMRFPLDQAAEALNSLQSRKSTGKVVVDITGD